MRQDIYQTMAEVEDEHWWFRGRRVIITRALELLKLPPNAAILDAGSGTGGNLPMLMKFGTVHGMELDAGARELANKRGLITVEPGELPGNIPFGATQFDCAVMFDVLEHIEQDYTSLTAIHARLKPGGKLLLTVPAFELLWSMHDQMHHHKRRYSLAPLIRLLGRAGYKVKTASYINFWLFPLIAFVRVLDRVTGGRIVGKKPDGNAELKVPSAPINGTLEKLFASEAGFLGKVRLPFGVSIIVLAEKV
jgi:SAM-dependent methyltransferase